VAVALEDTRVVVVVDVEGGASRMPTVSRSSPTKCFTFETRRQPPVLKSEITQ